MNYYGGQIIVSHVSKDGKGYSILMVNDIIIGVDDEDTYDVSNVHQLEDLTKQSSGTWTLTVIRDKHVLPKPRKKEKAPPYSRTVSGFLTYFDSKRIRGATLEANCNHMKLSWIEFQSLSAYEIKQWKEKYDLNKLYHKQMKMRQNSTVYIIHHCSDTQVQYSASWP
jgi:hypothetical protein